MSIIDSSYFFYEFKIASLETTPVAERIQYYINVYEPEYMEKLLGKSLYAAYKATPADARFTPLLAKLTAKPSPIAAYVFFEYQNGQSLQATAGADAKIKVENASVSINTYRRSDAWNLMVKLGWGIIQWLKNDAVNLDEFKACEVDCEILTKTNPFGLLS